MALGNDEVLTSLQKQIDDIDRQIDDLETQRGTLLNQINHARDSEERQKYLQSIEHDRQRLAQAKLTTRERW